MRKQEKKGRKKNIYKKIEKKKKKQGQKKSPEISWILIKSQPFLYSHIYFLIF